MYRFGTVSIEITSLCNLSCKHCFNGKSNSSTMSLENFKRVVELFGRYDIPQFVVSGGEPLLHQNICDMVYYMARQPYNFVLTTNGTIIDDAVLDIISKTNNILIQISLDGSCSKIHDEQRGMGAFEALQRFCGILDDKRIKYQFHTTITKINTGDIKDICEYAISRKINLDMAFVSLVGEAIVNMEKVCLSDNEKIYTYFTLKKLYANNIYIKLPEILYGCAFTSESYVVCFNIKADGKVNVCNCMKNEAYVGDVFDVNFGDFNSNAFIKIIENKCKQRQKILMNGICNDCIVTECSQGCYARALALGNEFGDDGECEFRKKIEIIKKIKSLIY